MSEPTRDLRALAEKATPGPWAHREPAFDSEAAVTETDGATHDIYSDDSDPREYDSNADAEFIAAANPTAILSLLDRLDALEAANEAMRNALTVYADPSFYHACAFYFDPPTGGFDEDFSEDHGDDFYDRPMPGKAARDTLTALGFGTLIDALDTDQ